MSQTESQKDAQDRPEHQTRYHQVINAMDDGFCVCELLFGEQQQAYGYRFLEVNLTFEHHSGLKQVQGKTTMELVPNLEQKWFDAFAKVVLNGETSRFEQGSEVMGRWFEIYAFPFQLPNKQHTFAVQFKDITKQKQQALEIKEYQQKLAASNQELALVNEELTAANEELASSVKDLSVSNEKLTRINNDMDSFIYTASHDLKAPISNLVGLIQLLERSLSPDSRASVTAQKAFQMMKKSIARFMHTIADLSEITRLQKESNQPAELVDLAEVIAEVRMDIALAIKEANAQIEVEVTTCGPVHFAPKNLRSVVYNLLSNAIKYRDPQRQPTVQIRCEETEHYQVLTVTDNGLGIDLAHDNRLFGMFQRLHDHVEGTGVGLYIVKKVVDNAGGKIEVESQVGQGTTFRVYFKR